jgi:hypothetical protein
MPSQQNISSSTGNSLRAFKAELTANDTIFWLFIVRSLRDYKRGEFKSPRHGFAFPVYTHRDVLRCAADYPSVLPIGMMPNPSCSSMEAMSIKIAFRSKDK